MKAFLIKANLLLTSFLFTASLYAQHSVQQTISPDPFELDITSKETVVLIFPAAIKSVDRGSKDILTKTVREVANVLKVKAARDSILPSNLHVFTADGKIYNFCVRYQRSPAHLTILFNAPGKTSATDTPIQFTAERLNDAEVMTYSQVISGLNPVRRNPKSSLKGNVRSRVSGVYLQKGVLFIQFAVKNKSAVPYPVDFTKTYIRDNTKSKRSSITEKEITPLYVYSSAMKEIDEFAQATIVFAFEQFTIAQNKHLVVELFEKNGDRHITCRLKGKDLLRARALMSADTRPPEQLKD